MKSVFIAVCVSLATIVSASAEAVLTVIHGIPGLPEPVTVTANGGALGSFDFGESLGPLEVPAGEYDVDVLLQGSPVDPLSATVTLEDGVNYSAVAHLTEDGNIRLSLFVNEVENLNRYRTRLTIRHTAQAPAVDVDLRRVIKRWRKTYSYSLIKALTLSNPDDFGPGQFGALDTFSGIYKANLLAAGDSAVAVSSDLLKLRRGRSYIVYPIGVLGGEFQLFVQEIPLS